MERNQRVLLVGERLACLPFIAWLQLVGVKTHSVLHHVLHAAPVVLLLVVRPSPARHLTGMLAGYLWVFMLGAVSPMLYDALILGHLVRPVVPYTWLAPVAAVLATGWAAANAALLRRRPSRFLPYALIGVGLAGVFAVIHPYLSRAFEYPLDRTLAGGYAWVVVLLAETAAVLAVPYWCAFRLSVELRVTKAFVTWQVVYWVFFVVAMVAGLHPAIIRDR
jgi:hypothetical protein